MARSLTLTRGRLTGTQSSQCNLTKDEWGEVYKMQMLVEAFDYHFAPIMFAVMAFFMMVVVVLVWVMMEIRNQAKVLKEVKRRIGRSRRSQFLVRTKLIFP
jgi:heme exporter protein D